MAGAFGFELFLEVRLGVVLELHQDASADLCSVNKSRSRLPVAMHRCQANPESNPPTFVEGRSGGRRDFVRGPIEARPRPSSVCRTRRMASRDGTPGLVHVVEGFDVLVQLLVHRRGLVCVGDHLDVGGAIGWLGRLERVVEHPQLLTRAVNHSWQPRAWGSST